MGAAARVHYHAGVLWLLCPDVAALARGIVAKEAKATWLSVKGVPLTKNGVGEARRVCRDEEPARHRKNTIRIGDTLDC